MKTRQISARIASTTKDELAAFLRARGLKQSRFVEEAVRHYLRVLRSLPEEGRVATSMVFTNQSFEEIVHAVKKRARPTSDLVKLMRGELGPEDGLY